MEKFLSNSVSLKKTKLFLSLSGWNYLKKLTILALFALTGMSLNAQIAAVSTGLGSGNSYSTLQLAFADINKGNITGDIQLQVSSSTTETVNDTLNASGTLAFATYTGSVSSYTSVWVYPTTTGVVISGSYNSSFYGLIWINGATNVTIDGRVDGTGTITNPSFATPALTISNTYAGNASAISILTGSNITVQCCLIEGTFKGSGGIIWMYSGTCNTISIDHNNITSYGTGAARTYYAVACTGGTFTSVNVTNNNIYDFINPGAASGGVYVSTGNASSWNIQGNSFYDDTQTNPTGAYSYVIIYTQGTSFTIQNNYIGGSASALTGSAISGTWGIGNASQAFFFSGIQLRTNATGTIQNNIIGGINMSVTGTAGTLNTTSGYMFTGVLAYSGSSAAKSVNVYSNTINNIKYTATVAGTMLAGIAEGSNGATNANTGTIQNNTISSISASNSTATNTLTFIGINTAYGGPYTITGNTIGSASANSIQIGTSSTTTGVQTFYGILNSSLTGPIYIDNTAGTGNTIENINVYGTTAASVFTGIINSAASANLTISNNTISSITSTGTGAGTFNCISNTGAVTTTLNIKNNVMSTLTAASSGANNYMIYNSTTGGSTIATISSNSMSRILFQSTNTTSVYGIDAISLLGTGSTFNIQNNTISSVSTNSTAGIGYTFYGISTATSSGLGAFTVSGNTIGSSTNPIQIGSSVTTTGVCAIYGIYMGSTRGNNITSNTVQYCTAGYANKTTSASAVYGIYINAGSPIYASQNNINNLTSNSTTGANFVYGFGAPGGPTPTIYYQNLIYNLTATGTGARVYGIAPPLTSSSAWIFNNIISGLYAPASNYATSTYGAVAGIYLATMPYFYVFYNTIYLSGTVANNGSSYGIDVANSAGIVDLYNNIVINLATETGSGYSAALGCSATGTGFAGKVTYNDYYIGSNNNNYYVSPGTNHGILVLGASVVYPCLSGYQSYVGGSVSGSNEMNSISENTQFVNTTTPGQTYFQISSSPTLCESHSTYPIYFPPPGSAGILGSPAIITTDCYGNYRYGNASYSGSGTAPDIGAVEGNYTGVTATGPGETGGNINLCSGSSTTLTLTYPGYTGTIQWQQSSQGTTGTEGTYGGGPSPQATWTNVPSGGNGTTYTTPSTGLPYNPTYYWAQLQEVNGSCTDTVYSTMVEVTQTTYTVANNTGSPSTICSGLSALIGTTSNGDIYSWTSNPTDASLNPSAANPTVSPSITTTYTLTETTSAPCSSTNSVIVTVNPTPAITPMTSTSCSGATFTVIPVNFTNGTVPAGTTYSWAAPSGTNITGNAGSGASNISDAPLNSSTTTSYTATYTVTPTLGSCTGSTFQVTVAVKPAPTVSFTVLASSYCTSASSVSLTGNQAPAGTFSGTGITDNGNGTAIFSPTAAGAGGPYTIGYTYNNGTCSNTATQTVTVNSVSSPSISNQPVNVSIASGQATSFSITPGGYGYTYQWQWRANSSSSWANVPLGSPYSGQTSATLNINPTATGMTGYQYQCIVYASICGSGSIISITATLTVTAAQSGLWDGTVSTNWGTGGNWDDGSVPVIGTDVVIPSSAPNQPLLTGTGICNSITIKARASLSVTGTLTCESTMQILSDATGTGAFTQSDAASVSITGAVTVQRYLSNLGYHYLASPIQGVECSGLSGFGGMTYTGGGTWYDPNHPSAISPYPNMWRIDEAHTHYLCQADYNSWYAPAKTEIMNPGVGYAINIATGAKTLSVSNTGSVLNAGKITASVSKEALSTNTIYNNDKLDQYGILNGSGAQNVGTGPTNGWHLIGNPYPSPVDWNAVVKDATDPGVGANIGYGISYFKPTTQWTGVYGVYYYNGVFGTTSGAFAPSRYIPTMQSFFIQNGFTGVVDNTPVLTFINSDRTVTSTALNANFYRSSESGVVNSEYTNISLYGYKESGSEIKDKAIIMFGAQNTDFGAGKLMNTDENVPNIYSFSEERRAKSEERTANSEEGLSIQGISELKSDMIIPLGFDVNTSGNYIINASEILNFPAGMHIYLEDLKNKVAQDLTLNPNYSFTINKGDADNRFFLKFAQSLQASTSSPELFDAYGNENILVVNYNNPSNEQATLSIFNILGQNVKELRMENGELRINLGVAPGAYLVRLVTNDKVYVKKVYIQ